VWFEAPYREGSAPSDRNPFLTASYALAAHHGERRVRVDGPVSPLLRDGLSVVAGWWQRWGLLEQAVPRVEEQGQPEPRGQEQGRTRVRPERPVRHPALPTLAFEPCECRSRSSSAPRAGDSGKCVGISY
jgi:hypothetical protein